MGATPNGSGAGWDEARAGRGFREARLTRSRVFTIERAPEIGSTTVHSDGARGDVLTGKSLLGMENIRCSSQDRGHGPIDMRNKGGIVSGMRDGSQQAISFATEGRRPSRAHKTRYSRRSFAGQR